MRFLSRRASYCSAARTADDSSASAAATRRSISSPRALRRRARRVFRVSGERTSTATRTLPRFSRRRRELTPFAALVATHYPRLPRRHHAVHGRNERERRELRPGFVHGHLGEEPRRTGKSAGPSAGTFPRARGRRAALPPPDDRHRRSTLKPARSRTAREPPVEQGGIVRDASGDGVGRGRTGETITQTFEEGPIGTLERTDELANAIPAVFALAVNNSAMRSDIATKRRGPPTGADMM